MFRLSILVVFLLLASSMCFAQEGVNEVNYEEIGLKYTIPQGWTGQNFESGVFFTSDVESAMIVVSLVKAEKFAGMKEEMAQPYTQENMELLPVGELIHYGAHGAFMDYEGVFQGNESKACIGSIYKPGNYGITIFATATAEEWTEEIRNSALLIIESVEFSDTE